MSRKSIEELIDNALKNPKPNVAYLKNALASIKTKVQLLTVPECETCNGSGECTYCSGSGECSDCNGTGEVE